MTLLNAPAYDERKEHVKTAAFVGSIVLIALLVVITLAGYLFGHGWAYTNLPAEHEVSTFFTALEQKNYDKAFAIWTNDPDWKKHPEKYKSYPVARFTEDWTTESPAGGPILTHHVDISKTDGSGTFGTGIIVAVRVTAAGKPGDQKLFMWYQKSDHTLTYPAPHILEY